MRSAQRIAPSDLIEAASAKVTKPPASKSFVNPRRLDVHPTPKARSDYGSIDLHAAATKYY